MRKEIKFAFVKKIVYNKTSKEAMPIIKTRI